MRSVTVQHTWEAGHRLPHIEGKCQSLHGHSWRVEVEVTSTDATQHEGVEVEFAEVKGVLRAFIDRFMDHGLMLGPGDELVPILRPHGKVFVLPSWPTVENVAEFLAEVVRDSLSGVTVLRVTVQETPTNWATWRVES